MEGLGDTAEEFLLAFAEGEVGAGAVEELTAVAPEGDDGDVVLEGRCRQLEQVGNQFGGTGNRVEGGVVLSLGGAEGGLLVGNVLEVVVLLALVHLETGVLQAVEQGDGVGAVYVAAAGAAGDEVKGGAAEYGHLFHVLEGKDAVVLQKNHAFQRALAGYGCMGFEVRLVVVGVGFHLRAALDQFQAAGDAYIQFLFAEGSVLEGAHDLFVLEGGTGLEHVVAGGNLLGGVVSAEPVGHDESLEAPLVTKDGGEEVFALGGVGAVEFVVGTHDGPGSGFLDGDFEPLQVNFALGAGADDGVVGGAVGLLVVEGEVLHGGAYVVALDAAHIGGGCLSGHYGILGIVLEVAPVQGMAVDVEGGSQVNIGPVLMHFLAHGGAHAFYQFLVPGAGEEGADREVGAVVGVLVAGTGRVDAETRRPVGQHDGGNAEAGDGVGGTCGAGDDVLRGAHDGRGAVIAGHTHADDKVCFFFQGHGLENLLHGRSGQLGFTALAACKGQYGGGE